MEGNDTLFSKGDASALKSLQNLQKLNIKSCDIVPKDIEPLLSILPKLTSINLSYNEKLGDEGLYILEKSVNKY